MKRNIFRGKVYSKLVRRLFLQTLALLGVAAVLGFLLRYLFQGKIGDSIVRLIQTVRGVDWYTAQEWYSNNIRNNLEYIVLFVILVVFFLLFWISLSWFMRYFDQIVEGVDQLAQESQADIRMEPELNFMETKLNEVKSRLRDRSEKAREAEQRKNDLVVYLAHDIKTPLTSVVGYLSFLDENTDMPPEQQQKYVRVALEKANRLETLINEFFEITRYNLQSVPLNRERIDLSYMMLQITDELYPLLVAGGREIRQEIPDSMTVYGDSEKLARVFNNILKNAIAYGTGGAIEIRAETVEQGVRLSFRNEGTIPAEKQKNIFEKFYRLDEARTSSSGGSGLGLAIARDIVLLHGGTIRADSRDGHTVFTVLLPGEERAAQLGAPS